MLKLSCKAVATYLPTGEKKLFSLSTRPNLPLVLRSQKGFLIQDPRVVPEGFIHYFSFSPEPPQLPDSVGYTLLDPEMRYLDDGDVVRVAQDGSIRVLFRSKSDHNSVLLTEQCNNYCLMCSQPPKRVNDDWIVDDVLELIPLIPRQTQSLGITGGEPTLFAEGLLEILRRAKSLLPRTAIHLLSNGRNFTDISFAQKYAAIGHPDLMVGIPIYSADPARHDYVVQALGAFDETIRGILNLKELSQKVEIRVVIHKQTYEGLPQLAEFIVRNLLFVDHVALMGLEMMGFTRANLDDLWIDPIEYKNHLSEAVRILNVYGIPVSIYNHPLCLINSDMEPFYKKSISDWKNEYAPECASCIRRNDCGGFFSSGIKFGYSKSITPFG